MPGGKSDTGQAEASDGGMSLAPGPASVSRCADSSSFNHYVLQAMCWPRLG